MPQKEIAAEFHTSTKAVSITYQAAMTALRDFWEDTEENKQIKNTMIALLKKLMPEDHCNIFIRHFFLGREQKQIAAEDGLSRGVISKKYKGVLYILRKIWNE